MSAVALRRARNLYIGVFFLIAFSFAPAFAKEKAKRASDFLFCLLTGLGFYIVGELTHMRSMCVNSLDDPHGRGKHRSPAKNHKETFLLSYFCMTKRRVQGGEATSERRRRDGVYQKSYKRRSTSYISPPVASRRPVRTHFPDHPTTA